MSLEVQIKVQSAQPTGTSDAGVLICIPRFFLVPIVATVNPTAGKGAFPVQCEEAADTGEQLAASPSPPCPYWGLGSQLGTEAPPGVSAGPCFSKQASQALGLALLLHTGGDFSSCVGLETQLEVLLPRLLWMVCFLF